MRDDSAGMIACIGHSHVRALGSAIRSAPDTARFDVISFWEEPDMAAPGAPPQLSAGCAARIAAADRVLSCIGGNAHAVIGVVEHHRAFDFVLAEAPELPLDRAREIVPFEAIRAAAARIVNDLQPLMASLRDHARGPVLQIAPPPPVADRERVARHVPWGLYPGQPREVAPPLLRYKLWRLSCGLIEAEARALGFGWAPPPDGVADAEGFLHPEFDHDGVHANGAYGERVLRQIGVW